MSSGVKIEYPRFKRTWITLTPLQRLELETSTGVGERAEQASKKL